MIFVLSIIIVLLDQISKYAAIKYLKDTYSHVVIPNFFRLSYVENYGAAFGILQNKKIFFVIITLIVISSISVFLVKNYHKINLFTRIGLGMFLGGTIGNFIDRVRFGYVVDFLSFRLFNRYEFPVFNIADISIVIGTIIILILVLLDKYEV
ncbi:signal peptidase II [Tissierella sp. MB52-C2]|uniref:signal peptidase II n=1 Tax=Tissierella sp. MB52-C2 TaxID=3070999 RepID=UPI00280AF778|nr:signal peptidase II [Tissierella sp. MB52-C2]WMM26766.1 signal peptidase II [Tissierella sp. MB52-C2]